MIAAALGCEVVRYRGGECGPAFGAARLARLAARGAAPEELCKPPDIADVVAPDPALTQAFARARERFVDLYRALKPEFLRAAADWG